LTLLYGKRFATNHRGRFVFRFRNGPKPIIGLPEPFANGNELFFEQRFRCSERRRNAVVYRAPRFSVEGLPNRSPGWSQARC